MFFDRLREACRDRNTSPSAIALKVGRSKSNVTGWRNGQKPSIDTVTDIAEALKFPTDFFLEQPPFDCWTLINQNRKGFLYYTGISAADLEAVWNINPENPDESDIYSFVSFLSDAVLSALPTEDGDWIVEIRPIYQRAERPADERMFDNIFPIKTQKIPLLGEIAAGVPIFCNEDRESYVMVGTDVKADFALQVKGDSMINARIMDGDIVFIRKQDFISNGEIAAVAIGDEATLKRVYYYPDQSKLILQAENPAYAPFVFVGAELEQAFILGKAIAFQSDVR